MHANGYKSNLFLTQIIKYTLQIKLTGDLFTVNKFNQYKNVSKVQKVLRIRNKTSILRIRKNIDIKNKK